METYAAYKICIFGEGGVGKTSLTKRYLTGLFDDATKMTMGASIFVKYVDLQGKRIALQLWDFGGEEQYRFLLPVYAHGSAAAIFMYDITRYVTLQKADNWVSIFKEGLDDKDIPILLVGAKLDLESNRGTPKSDSEVFSKDHGFFNYIECSAKTGENIEEIFQLIINEIFKRAGI